MNEQHDSGARRSGWMLMLGAQALGVVLLGVTFWIATRSNVPYAMLMRDPARHAGLPFYAGHLSFLGAVFWCVAATVCLFTAAAGRALPRAWRAFFLCWGLLSALLMIDDLFLIHDGLLRWLRLDERPLLGGYALLVPLLCIVFYRLIRQTPFALLAAALILFAGSLFLETGIVHPAEAYKHLLEDGAKLLGAMNWCVYFVSVGLTQMRRLGVAR